MCMVAYRHAFCAATYKLKVIAARRGYSCAELAVGWVSQRYITI